MEESFASFVSLKYLICIVHYYIPTVDTFPYSNTPLLLTMIWKPQKQVCDGFLKEIYQKDIILIKHEFNSLDRY